MSIHIHLPQSSFQDPPELSITSTSQLQTLTIFSFHNLTTHPKASTHYFPVIDQHTSISSLS